MNMLGLTLQSPHIPSRPILGHRKDSVEDMLIFPSRAEHVQHVLRTKSESPRNCLHTARSYLMRLQQFGKRFKTYPKALENHR